MTFRDLAYGAEFVLPDDIMSKGKVVFQKLKGRNGIWKHLAQDENGMEHIVAPNARVHLIESGKKKHE